MSEFRTEDIERGLTLASAIGDNKWELGDLANQVCPATNGSHDDGRLQRFADEIDLAYQTLRVYRQIAAAWPRDTRVSGASWTVYRELASNPDRFDIIAEQPFDQDGVKCDRWTLRGIRHRLERPAFDQPVPPLPPDEPPVFDDLPPLRDPVPLPWDALLEGGRLCERLVALRQEFEGWFTRSEERDDHRAILSRLGPEVDEYQTMFDRKTTEVMEATWS